MFTFVDLRADASDLGGGRGVLGEFEASACITATVLTQFFFTWDCWGIFFRALFLGFTGE